MGSENHPLANIKEADVCELCNVKRMHSLDPTLNEKWSYGGVVEPDRDGVLVSIPLLCPKCVPIVRQRLGERLSNMYKLPPGVKCLVGLKSINEFYTHDADFWTHSGMLREMKAERVAKIKMVLI